MDYCDCGFRADRLCVRCRKPTCAVSRDEHTLTSNGVPAVNYRVDISATNWAGFAACPNSLGEIASATISSADLSQVLVPGSAFEQLCAIATGGIKPVPPLSAGSNVQGQPSYTYARWTCPYLPAITAGEFAREFAASCQRRGVPPVKGKAGTFKKISGYVARNSRVGADIYSHLYHQTSWAPAADVLGDLFISS